MVSWWHHRDMSRIRESNKRDENCLASRGFAVSAMPCVCGTGNTLCFACTYSHSHESTAKSLIARNHDSPTMMVTILDLAVVREWRSTPDLGCVCAITFGCRYSYGGTRGLECSHPVDCDRVHVTELWDDAGQGYLEQRRELDRMEKSPHPTIGLMCSCYPNPTSFICKCPSLTSMNP
jgi:hypothetical protein